MREARRAAVRITTNYIRLGINLILGLIFVPFILYWVGEGALGLILLLGAGGGIAAVFREITVRAVIRELGAALHTNDECHFRTIFNSAIVISLVMSGVVTVLFVALYFCLPLLRIPHEFDAPAQIMVICAAVYNLITTALSPVFNMLVVTERFVSYNFWTLAERCTVLFSALLLYFGFNVTEPAAALSQWSVLVAVLQIAVFLIPVVHLMAIDPRLRPAPRRATRAGVRLVSKTLGLYVAVELASMLYEKVSPLIVNVFFGLPGNAIYGVGYIFVSYVRQATAGVSGGLDAVSARVSTTGKKPLQALIHHSTRLQGLVALPAGVAVFVLAEPLIRLWIGGRAPPEYIPGIVLTVRIMTISLTARAIAEGWTMILYGAGFLRRYAPLVLAGGLAFVPVAVSLLMFFDAPKNPDFTLFIVPGVFTAMQFIVFFLLLPRVTARCIGVRYIEVFIPLWRPALATALASLALVLLPQLLARDPARPGLATLIATCAAFGALYAALVMALVLTAAERERFVWGPLRRLQRRGEPSLPAS